MVSIKTCIQKQATLDFDLGVYSELERRYKTLAEFMDRLEDFNATLVHHKQSYNINPYPDCLKGGIYILGKIDSELEIFPSSSLVLKCSRGQFGAENLKRQFDRSIQLAQICDRRFSVEEKSLLQICPVYLHLQNRTTAAFFKQILFMQRAEGVALAEIQTGFSQEFCQVFKIPTIEQICRQPQFVIHRWLDRNKRRQLVKIQTAYLFQRLWQRGIKILSLNQRNIIASPNGDRVRYTIIDPIPDYLKPCSPLYNLITSRFCR